MVDVERGDQPPAVRQDPVFVLLFLLLLLCLLPDNMQRILIMTFTVDHSQTPIAGKTLATVRAGIDTRYGRGATHFF